MVQGLWRSCVQLLAHPHAWVRKAAARLASLAFAQSPGTTRRLSAAFAVLFIENTTLVHLTPLAAGGGQPCPAVSRTDVQDQEHMLRRAAGQRRGSDAPASSCPAVAGLCGRQCRQRAAEAGCQVLGVPRSSSARCTGEPSKLVCAAVCVAGGLQVPDLSCWPQVQETAEHVAAPAEDEHTAHELADGSDDEEPDTAALEAGQEPEFSLAGLIRRMTRAAGDRRHEAGGRRLVALRFIAGLVAALSCMLQSWVADMSCSVRSACLPPGPGSRGAPPAVAASATHQGPGADVHRLY